MIDELPVEKDLVGIPVQHDMLGVVDIKAIDTLLVAAVMDGRDGFWKFCRLQDEEGEEYLGYFDLEH